ncbi:uncharacterized protein V1510DRAFT_405234 [Dipodascopsis tothii]|uniref:uncharacterized protein n=1 Tax=Dipodascopsis tothii TaxID=44089 RepID=UPI0034CD1252
MAAPTETTILTSFLTSGNALSDIVPFSKFAAYFPKDKRDLPAVRTLYADLQGQHARAVAEVGRNIRVEQKISNKRLRNLRAAEAEAGTALVDSDPASLQLGRAGQELADRSRPRHMGISEVNEQLQTAVETLSDELNALEDAAADDMAVLADIVDRLSDLRYGRISAQARDGAITGLQDLYKTAEGL